MNKLPASTGWLWIKQGVALFMKQPGGLTMLVVAYSFLMQVCSIVPLIGPLATMVLMPVFGVGFMYAYGQVEQNKRVTISMLFIAFRSPQLRRLIALGALYLAAMALLGVITWLHTGDLLLQIQKSAISIDDAGKQINMPAMVFWMMVVTIPTGMALFFSPLLVHSQQMKVGKALFYSFFAIVRTAAAFTVFLLAWMGIFMLFTQIMNFILGQAMLVVVMRAIFLPLLFVVYQCSAYASYKQFFGSPWLQPQEEETTP